MKKLTTNQILILVIIYQAFVEELSGAEEKFWDDREWEDNEDYFILEGLGLIKLEREGFAEGDFGGAELTAEGILIIEKFINILK